MSAYRKELLSPDGEKYVSTSAIETNDLIYGSGYREVDESANDTAPTTVREDKPSASYSYGGEVSP